MQYMKDQNTEKDLCSNTFQLSSGLMKVVEICTGDALMYGKNRYVALLQEYIRRRIIAHHYQTPADFMQQNFRML